MECRFYDNEVCVLSSQGIPGDQGYPGVTGIAGGTVSLCLSVVQSCAIYYVQCYLTLPQKVPNVHKKR